MAERAFELAHLRADGLHRHAQPRGGASHPAFLGHNPEVVQVPVAEVQAHLQFFSER
jgi:hypothetical protein